MTDEEKQEIRLAAKANGVWRSSDWDTLEEYIAAGDEDAADGLIWAVSEEGEERPARLGVKIGARPRFLRVRAR